MAAILNSAIMSSAILDSAILVFPLKLTHTCQDWFPPFAQKHFTHTSLPTICTKETSLIHWFPPFALNNFTHSFWLNLMMAAILNSAILDSAILHKTLTQTNSISIKLIHSHSSWWWAAILNSAILNLAILDSAILEFPLKLTHTCQDWFPPFAQNTSLTLPFPPFAQKKLHSFIGSHHLH